jgi:hypothetical protein
VLKVVTDDAHDLGRVIDDQNLGHAGDCQPWESGWLSLFFSAGSP